MPCRAVLLRIPAPGAVRPSRARRDPGGPRPADRTAAVDLRTASPAGQVWLPLTRTGHEVRLADLDDAIPDPWLAYRQEQARKRREAAERDRMYRDDQDDDEDPIPEGPAPHASGEVNRLYGGSGHWAPGRTAS